MSAILKATSDVPVSRREEYFFRTVTLEENMLELATNEHRIRIVILYDSSDTSL